jgi:hypothetical protein
MAAKKKSTKELAEAAIAAASTTKKTTKKRSSKKKASKKTRTKKDPLAELRHCTSTVKRAKTMIMEADMGAKSLASKRR